MNLLTCCPICNKNTLYLQHIEQYARSYKICKTGKESVHYKNEYIGPEDWSMFICENEECDFFTDSDFQSEQYKISICRENGKYYYERWN